MNLATTYFGLELRNPFVVGASPLCDHVAGARALEDAGAAALVMRSLFEEQIDPAPPHAAPMAGPGDYLEVADYQLSPAQYLAHLKRLKAALKIPVIASLNGQRPGEWIDFATKLESAGADAIELNFYRVVTDTLVPADQIETDLLAAVRQMSAAVNLPVAAKLSPFHTALAQLAVGLELSGAAGLVLFNRFYQPDITTSTLRVQPLLHLSTPEEILLRLRWLAILSPNLRGTLVASGGFHTADDAAKAILTGAHAVQLVSVLLRHGPTVIPTLLRNLEAWLHTQGFASLAAARGLLNLRGCRDAGVYERANYLRTLRSWQK